MSPATDFEDTSNRCKWRAYNVTTTTTTQPIRANKTIYDPLQQRVSSRFRLCYPRHYLPRCFYPSRFTGFRNWKEWRASRRVERLVVFNQKPDFSGWVCSCLLLFFFFSLEKNWINDAHREENEREREVKVGSHARIYKNLIARLLTEIKMYLCISMKVWKNLWSFILLEIMNYEEERESEREKKLPTITPTRVY